MPNTREKLIELLLASFEKCYSTICVRGDRRCKEYNEDERTTDRSCQARLFADHLIANGVTVQEWISVKDRLPDENGYYLCEVCFSSVSDCKSYRRMILYWEDNVWIDMPNCFKTRKPTHWMPLPQPPKGE